MDVAVLGTGIVGRTLAGAIAGLGHRVWMGTRDAASARARSDSGPMTTEPLGAWLDAHPSVELASFAEAASAGELIINATNGGASLEALQAAGSKNLAGKLLIDASNPLDFSAGFPPSLLVSNTDSLGERIQATFPAARVVKTLNTVTAALMVDPASVAGADHTLFVSGNDQAAKDEVAGLMREWFGWRHVLDLGDITTARGAEMYLALWVRAIGALGTPMFNVRVVT